MPLDDMPEIANLHIRAVLHGTQEGGDPTAVVIEAHLGLRVRPEHPGRVVLQAAARNSVANGKRDRQQLRGLVGGVAEHDALVTGAAFVHTEGNIRRLLPYQDTPVSGRT